MADFNLTKVLKKYGIFNYEFRPFGKGLINDTWQVIADGETFILQRINQKVFENPEWIDENVRKIAEFLSKTHSDYFLPVPVKTVEGKGLVNEKDNYLRLISFVKNSITLQFAETGLEAYEAAAQFSKFVFFLSDFPVDTLHVTIHDFHNLDLRFKQFEDAVQSGNPVRIKESQYWIDFLIDHKFILDEYDQLIAGDMLKKRVMHHDTKISNVLFDEDKRGLCVIDLDTVMPGYFISDLGDMMRNYLSLANEEETDFKKVKVREDVYAAVCEGYLKYLPAELSESEKSHFHFSGSFMIYMQALRFLADYINNDVYYGAAYPQHNLNRAINQCVLLKDYLKLK